jgi:hypothetical protein
MSNIPHDRSDQLGHVQSGLLQDEQIYCVYDDKGFGSGFIALTNLRVIILNKSFISAFPSHKGVSATISLPYSHVSSVSTLSKTSAFGRFFSDSHIYLITNRRRPLHGRAPAPPIMRNTSTTRSYG